ncbi:hypothetical protein [Moorena producens]|uniref:hypothetical protein n=1 Tax=Moorena producens TaxID=1155739 RepID=UPI003C7840DE
MANLTKQTAKIIIGDIDISHKNKMLLNNVTENELSFPHGGLSIINSRRYILTRF